VLQPAKLLLEGFMCQPSILQQAQVMQGHLDSLFVVSFYYI